ncbi:hypothetical protein [Litchfieldella rifensis]|uniref:Uncharacterized protein n=1 Tax=Litchfieldella rifensis TaxID=762643 RepID=A0ABV7LPH6_9GAMM
MMRQTKRFAAPFAMGILTLGLALPAQAYVGPGAGLSLLTALWGLIAAVGVAVVFLVMWPIRRMRRRKAAATQAASQPTAYRADAEPSVQQGADAKTSADTDSTSRPPRT